MNGVSLLEAVTGKTGENQAPLLALCLLLQCSTFMCHLILFIYLLNSNPPFNKISFVPVVFKKKMAELAVIVR